MAIKGGFQPGHLGVTLFVQDAGAAKNFYQTAFGAVVVYEHTLDDGTVTGFDLRAGKTFFAIASANPKPEAYEKHGSPRGADTIGGSTVMLWLYVEDVDSTLEQVRKAGGQVRSGVSEVENPFWGDRVAQFNDPFGYSWRLATMQEEVSYDELAPRLAAKVAEYRA